MDVTEDLEAPFMKVIGLPELPNYDKTNVRHSHVKLVKVFLRKYIVAGLVFRTGLYIPIL